jgi:hypothetical protein
MAITNGYITADEALAYLRLSDQVDRLLVEGWVEAASRSIDRYCMRRFYADDTPTARTFTPTEWTVCTVDDIASTLGLVVRTDEDDDGVYERLWAATEYQLEPVNALAAGDTVYVIRATGRASGPSLPLYKHTPTLQVTARWGWPSVPAAVKQACYLQVGRLALRRQSPGGILVSPDLGSSDRLYAQMDPDARVLLDPFRRLEFA